MFECVWPFCVHLLTLLHYWRNEDPLIVSSECSPSHFLSGLWASGTGLNNFDRQASNQAFWYLYWIFLHDQKGTIKKENQALSKYIYKFHFQLYARNASCNAFYTNKILNIGMVMKANHDCITLRETGAGKGLLQ